jgi:hypothetical protein
MPLTKQIKMRTTFFLIVLLLSINLIAQNKTLCNERIIQSVIRNVFPLNDKGDTCLNLNVFLVVEIDSKSKVVAISFSDNAGNSMKEYLAREKKKGKIKFAEMDSIAKVQKIRNKKLVFPMVYTSAYKCIRPASNYLDTDNPDFYKINGKKLEGNLVFCDIITIGMPKPIY